MPQENPDKSVIDHPRFSEWVRDFNPHDPKLIQEAQKRSEETEVRYAALEERAKKIEWEMNWGIPTRTLPLFYVAAMLFTPFTAKASLPQKEDSRSEVSFIRNLMTDAASLYTDSKMVTNYIDKAKTAFSEKKVPFKDWHVTYEVYPNAEKLHASLVLPTNEVPSYLSNVSPDFYPRIKVAPFRQLVWSGPRPKKPFPSRSCLSFNLDSNQGDFDVSHWLKPAGTNFYRISFMAGAHAYPTPVLMKNGQSFSKFNQGYHFSEYPSRSFLTIDVNSYPKNLTRVSVVKGRFPKSEEDKQYYWFLGTPQELMDRTVEQKSVVLQNTPMQPLDEEQLGWQISDSKKIKYQVEDKFHEMEEYALKNQIPIKNMEMNYAVCGFENGHEPSRTFVSYKFPVEKGEKACYFKCGSGPRFSLEEISYKEYNEQVDQAKENSWITLSATRFADGKRSIGVSGNNPKCRYNDYKKMEMSYNLNAPEKLSLTITDIPYESYGFSAEREIKMVFNGESRESCQVCYLSPKEIHLFSDRRNIQNLPLPGCKTR